MSFRDCLSDFQESISEGRFPVVDMRDYAEIADVFTVGSEEHTFAKTLSY